MFNLVASEGVVKFLFGGVEDKFLVAEFLELLGTGTKFKLESFYN